MAQWRLLDTGLLGATENIAYNQALLDAVREGEAGNTLRFLQFRPSALIGYHQSPHQELNLAYCEEHGIEIQRRITGGGAIYFDETQLGWELYTSKQAMGGADMTALAERICNAAAEGIRTLGVEAYFRPRNDIEVGGRKISGTGGIMDGDAILYQGTLLLDFNVERMFRVLRIPAEKISDKNLQAARERVVTIRELLGELPPLEDVKAAIADAFARAFDMNLAPAPLNAWEEARHAEVVEEFSSPDWLYLNERPREETPVIQGFHKGRGGLIRVSLWIDSARNHIKQVWITGDFFVSPKRAVLDLEAALKDTPVDQVEARVRGFFADNPAQWVMLEADDFIQAIGNTLAAREEAV